jgi:hypothetical protein
MPYTTMRVANLPNVVCPTKRFGLVHKLKSVKTNLKYKADNSLKKICPNVFKTFAEFVKDFLLNYKSTHFLDPCKFYYRVSSNNHALTF